MIIGGDFNTALHSSDDTRPYFDYGFEDSLDMIANPLPHSQRDTHYYFSPTGEMHAEQIDALLVYSETNIVTEAYIYPTRDKNGRALAAPKSFEEREQRPSDHLPIGIEISLKR